MRPMLICAIIILTVFISCTDDILNPTGVDGVTVYSLSITGLPVEVQDIEGTEKELPFTVTVKDSDGKLVSGVEVDLTVEIGDATVSPDNATTGSAGTFDAACTITMTKGRSMLQIRAAAGGFTKTSLISLNGLGRPAALLLNADITELVVLPAQNGEIKLTAVVTDQNGVGIPGIQPEFALLPDEPEGEIFGSLSQPTLTDSSGQSRSVFSTNGGVGVVIVRCEIPGLTSQDEPLFALVQLSVILQSFEIGNISIMALPDYFKIDPDSTAEADVLIRVQDVDNVAIPDLQLKVSADLGMITVPSLTDEAGLARAKFFNNHQFGTAHISAGVDGIGFSASTEIQIESIYSEGIQLNLTSDVDSINADGGLTKATLRVELKDSLGTPYSNREIEFRAPDFGMLLPTVTTDSVGVAINYFYAFEPSLDEDGIVVPAVVEAWYLPLQLVERVEILIKPLSRVASIRLEIQKERMKAGRSDSTLIRAMCELANGRPGAEGIEVHFEVDNGRFTQEVVVTGRGGMAETYFIAPQTVGRATIRAYVINGPEDIIYSAPWTIRLEAGPPNYVRLVAVPNQLMANDPAALSTITATVSDTAGNHITESVLVSFTKTLGSLDRTNAATDERGEAVVHLMPGVESGVSTITATVNTPAGQIRGQTTVRIVSSIASTILLEADPTEIPANNGFSTLRAFLYDPNGNLVEQPHLITFEIIGQDNWSEEEQCNINRHGLFDQAQTSGGIAEVTLNAGSLTGIVMLKASTFSEELQQDITRTEALVTVIGGDPENIDVDVDMEGVDAGGGAWELEVSARISDANGNPVLDGIPVEFSVDEIASIGVGETGNQNRRGESYPGIAFTSLVYASSHTMDTVTVSALLRLEEEEEIMIEREIILPLQAGFLVLQATPAVWMIDEEPDANIRVQAILRDGHDILIDNAPVLFSATRGYYFWYDHRADEYREYDLTADPPQPPIKYTGWNSDNGHPQHSDDPGVATVYLKGEEMDFFLDNVTPEINVQLNAEVAGYEDVFADPRIVVITRHP